MHAYSIHFLSLYSYFFFMFYFFFFTQKTAYDMHISDWSSDVCSSDLIVLRPQPPFIAGAVDPVGRGPRDRLRLARFDPEQGHQFAELAHRPRPLAEPPGYRFGDKTIKIEAVVRIGKLCPPFAAGQRQREIAPQPIAGERQLCRIAPDEIGDPAQRDLFGGERSEEHTSELQSLMRISYAVFCLKKKNYISPYDIIR